MTGDAPPHPRAGSAAADRAERRAARTRALVLGVIRDALAERPLEQLSVTDVCRRAGVNRVTFYGHWPDVRAAAGDALTEVIDRIAAVDDTALRTARGAAARARLFEHALTAQLEEVRSGRVVYRQLARSPLFEQRLREALERRAALAIDALRDAGSVIPGAESGIAAAHLAGGVVAATLRWIAADSDDVAAGTREMLDQLPPWWPRGAAA